MVTARSVSPGPNGSKAMPPFVTLPESNWPPPIVTVRLDGSEPASVVTFAALPLLLVTVAVTDDPARTPSPDRCVSPRDGVPTRTVNAWSADNDVVFDGPTSRTDRCTTVPVPP